MPLVGVDDEYNSSVGLTWIAAAGFIPITANPRITARPLPPTKACFQVRSRLTPTVIAFSRAQMEEPSGLTWPGLSWLESLGYPYFSDHIDLA